MIKTLARILLYGSLAIALSVLAAIFIQQLNSKTTFDINARTEIVSGTVAREVSMQVDEGHVCYGPANPIAALTGAPALCGSYGRRIDITEPMTLTFVEGSQIRLARLGTGNLEIDVRSTDENAVVLVAGSEITEGAALLSIPSSQLTGGERRLTIPLLLRDAAIGSVTGTVATGRDPMLLSAEIAILGRQVFASKLLGLFGLSDESVFRTEKIQIGLGDMVSIPKSARNDNTIFSGVAVVSDTRGMELAIRVRALRLEVSRFQAEGYHLTVSFLDRLARDPFAQVIWGLLTLLAGSGVLLLIPRRLSSIGQS